MELYPEFTPIYIGMAATLVLLLAVLVLVIIALVKVGRLAKGGRGSVKAVYGGKTGIQSYGSVVFCKSCATEYEASEKCCPKCGTPR